MQRKNKKQQVTNPYIMKAHKKGAGKAVQSDLLTLDLFTAFMYVPTAAQVKQKPHNCSLTMPTGKGSTTVLSSRYLDIKALSQYLKSVEKQTPKKEVKAKKK